MYELVYFDLAGRAEAIRLAFAVGGVEFKDTRVEFQGEQFTQLKESGNLPYGQVPVLYIDGEVYSQSQALLRYVGKITGLYPEDPLSALRVDELMCAFEDLLISLKPTFFISDPDEKLSAQTEWRKNVFPKFGKHWESQATENYFFGEAMTIADLLIATFFQWFDESPFMTQAVRQLVSDYPKVNEVCKRVLGREDIKAYYNGRA